MNPAKITIGGNYWDCQIYRGRLYLFTVEGSVKTVDWNKLMQSLRFDAYVDIALSYAFQNGRNLYHQELHELFADHDIRELLRSKFAALADREIVLEEHQLNDFLIGEQGTPFQELHTDTEVFSNRLYVLTHNSLESTSIHGKSKRFPVGKTPQKHFDLYGFTLRANRFARLAISAGDDGLFEYNGSSNYPWAYYDEQRMERISQRHSSFADYSFLSIYNSSLAGQSSLSYFTWKEERRSNQRPEKEFKREFDEANIFETADAPNQSYLSWGSNEKIYRAVDGGLEVVRFNNYAKPYQPIFSHKKFIDLKPWKGRVISASIAYFGTVLHCENAVVVMLSDGTYYNIPGQVTRVRIFPRSLNYENHLHVIHDNCLEIYSFNNDYFVNQKEKDFGFAYKAPKTFGFVRGGYAAAFESDEDFYDLRNVRTKEEDTNIEPDDLPF